MYVCCVGYGSLDVFDELNDCTCNLGLCSFRICVCMFIVIQVLHISSATVIIRGGGGHLVEPLCYGVVSCVVPSLLCGSVWYGYCYVRR